MKEQLPNIIIGGSHADHRGSIRFVNEFDMSAVKRFYIIENADTDLKRGWRGHKIEQRWFSVLEGAFLIRLIKIDNWECPGQTLPKTQLLLKAEENAVLHIPAGYASCIQAGVEGSKLMVFADHGIEHAKFDDYLYPEEYFDTV